MPIYVQGLKANELAVNTTYTPAIVDQNGTGLINIGVDSVNVVSSYFTYGGERVATLANISLPPVTALSSAGGDITLVSNGAGPDLAIKGITAGAGITVIEIDGGLKFDAAPPPITLSSAGGVGAHY